MDGNDTPLRGPARAPRRWLGAAGLVGAGLLAGGILAGSQLAGAQSGTSTSTSTSSSRAASPGDQALDRAGHGPNETLLTGTTATRVRAAALKAVPGGTILRVETDSEGSPYEAHVRMSDGSLVTVKVDKDFNVTDTLIGFGSGSKQNGSDSSGA